MVEDEDFDSKDAGFVEKVLGLPHKDSPFLPFAEAILGGSN